MIGQNRQIVIMTHMEIIGIHVHIQLEIQVVGMVILDALILTEMDMPIQKMIFLMMKHKILTLMGMDMVKMVQEIILIHVPVKAVQVPSLMMVQESQ